MASKKSTKKKATARKTTRLVRKPSPSIVAKANYSARVSVLATIFTLLSLVFVSMAYYYYVV